MLKELFIAFGILAVCLVIHITGIVLLGDQLARRRQRIERHRGTVHSALVLMSIFAFLIMLHVTEACVWATFYAWRGLFQNYETSLYFSLKSYATIGYGDVVLPKYWRLLGTIEGISGALLCGLSTAFLFTIMDALFRLRVERSSGENNFSHSVSTPGPTTNEAGQPATRIQPRP